MEGIIHIAGVMPRIGTTTAALKLTAFLKRFGYNAAYVEANQQNYIWGCKTLYEDFKEEESGKSTCSGIELYTADRLEDLTEGGTHYDYIVCDYGNLMTKDFDRTQFSNCSANVIVGGIKPNEIHQTERIMIEKEFRNAVWLFNFIQKKDQEEILKQMKEHANFTAFLPYIPDPFYTEVEKEGEENDCFKKVMSAVCAKIAGRNRNGKI